MSEKKRKLEPKLKLDLDFNEALERFAQTDPEEVKESIERAKQKKPPGDTPSRRPARKKHEGTSSGRSRQSDEG